MNHVIKTNFTQTPPGKDHYRNLWIVGRGSHQILQSPALHHYV